MSRSSSSSSLCCLWTRHYACPAHTHSTSVPLPSHLPGRHLPLEKVMASVLFRYAHSIVQVLEFVFAGDNTATEHGVQPHCIPFHITFATTIIHLVVVFSRSLSPSYQAEAAPPYPPHPPSAALSPGASFLGLKTGPLRPRCCRLHRRRRWRLLAGSVCNCNSNRSRGGSALATAQPAVG